MSKENPTSDQASSAPSFYRSNLFMAGYLLALTLLIWWLVRVFHDGDLTTVLAELITRAGAEWVMYLLIALSVFSSGVFFERLFFYRRNTVNLGVVWPQLRRKLKEGNTEEVLNFSRTIPGMEGEVTRACLQSYDQGAEAMEEAMLASLSQERLKYDRNLSILGTLGNNAPFIGLFGTVLGIIKAFLDLSNNISGGAATVMGGISEALVATAIGLLVAIPSVIAFNYLNGRVTLIMSNTETLARTVMKQAKKEKAQEENDQA